VVLKEGGVVEGRRERGKEGKNEKDVELTIVILIIVTVLSEIRHTSGHTSGSLHLSHELGEVLRERKGKGNERKSGKVSLWSFAREMYELVRALALSVLGSSSSAFILSP